MRYLSVCSGIEAATVAWHPLGWEAAAFSEIEAFPRAVLAHHYPDVPCHGDFTTIGADEYGPIDLLVGGTPCQSFSIAGLRGGLADDRGNLALEYLRLADRTRPRWLVWENVPGVLSSNGGRDFGSILGGMAELGYGTAYRVLDAQHFGVPQRRRRVFVVGYLGDWRRAAAVLFERHSLSGHPAPRRGEGQRVAPCIDASFARLQGCSGQDANHGHGHLVTEPIVLMERGRDGVPTLERRQDGTANAILTPNGGRGGLGVGAIAYQVSGNCGAWETGEITGAFDTSTDRTSQVLTFSIMPMNSGKDYKARETEVAQPCMATGPVGGNQGGDYVVDTYVRRFTVQEVERLFGYPDDYTLIPYRNKPAADGPRYKALGNSMAVPVMRWIGERIAAVDAISERKAA